MLYFDWNAAFASSNEIKLKVVLQEDLSIYEFVQLSIAF